MLRWQLMGNCRHFSNFTPHLPPAVSFTRPQGIIQSVRHTVFPFPSWRVINLASKGGGGGGEERSETKTNILYEVSPVVRAVFLLQTTSPRNVYKTGPGTTSPTTTAAWTTRAATASPSTSGTSLTGRCTSGYWATPSPSYLSSSPSSSSCTSGGKLSRSFNSHWNKKNQNLPRMFYEFSLRPHHVLPLKECVRFTSFKCLDWQVVS